MPMTNEEALQLLTEAADVKFVSIPASDTIVVAEGMGGDDWLCFRVPPKADLPVLGTTLIRAYVEALS